MPREVSVGANGEWRRRSSIVSTRAATEVETLQPSLRRRTGVNGQILTPLLVCRKLARAASQSALPRARIPEDLGPRPSPAGAQNLLDSASSRPDSAGSCHFPAARPPAIPNRQPIPQQHFATKPASIFTTVVKSPAHFRQRGEFAAPGHSHRAFAKRGDGCPSRRLADADLVFRRSIVKEQIQCLSH